MKVTCPKCQSIGEVNESKIPDSGTYATCPKCQFRFLVKKQPNNPKTSKDRQTPDEWAKEYIQRHVKQARVDETKSVNTSSILEESRAPVHQIGRLYHKILENKERVVLFVTAGILVVMLSFPPFYVFNNGRVISIGYFFITGPPHKLAQIDLGKLLVQCLIVALLGVIFWLAFRRRSDRTGVEE